MHHQMLEERNCISSKSKKQSRTNHYIPVWCSPVLAVLNIFSDLTFACYQSHLIFSWLTLHLHISTSKKTCMACTYIMHWLHFWISLEKNPPQHLFGCHPEGQCPQVCEIHFPQNMCFKGIDITPPEQFSLKVIDTTSAEQLSFL